MELLDAPNLAAYWLQLSALVLMAGPWPRLLAHDAPQLRYVYWRALLVLAALLPSLQTWRPAPALDASPLARDHDVVMAPLLASSHEPAVELWQIAPIVLAAGTALWGLGVVVGLVRLQRMRRLGQPFEDDLTRELQRRLGARAEVRCSEAVTQPVTFGLLRPCVLLPPSLQRQPEHIRMAVIAHELWHVRRRDWTWLVIEEAVRAALWFVPAVWWLISRIRRAREEVVDRLTVATTGDRHAYLEALLAFSTEDDVMPAPAFAKRRHLFQRILLISREELMSAKRLIFVGAVLAAITLTGAWYITQAFPLSDRAEHSPSLAPGPWERAAVRVSSDMPAPALLEQPSASYPADPLARQMSARVTVRAVVDASGQVVETRVVGVDLASAVSQASLRGEDFPDRFEEFLSGSTFRIGAGGAPLAADTLRMLVDAYVAAAENAVRGYRYQPPEVSPLAFDVTVHFAGSRAEGNAIQQSPLAAGAVRVGYDVRPPRKIHDVRPEYPASARDAGISGVVILEVRVEGDGRVSQARVLRSIPALDAAALEAVGQWRFEPTLLNGVPTPVVMIVSMGWTLTS